MTEAKASSLGANLGASSTGESEGNCGGESWQDARHLTFWRPSSRLCAHCLHHRGVHFRMFGHCRRPMCPCDLYVLGEPPAGKSLEPPA